MALFENLADNTKFVLVVGLAIFGGLVRPLVHGDCTVKEICFGMIIAGFTGIVVYLLLQDITWLGEGPKSAIVGMSGYGGPNILKIISDRVCTFLNKFNIFK